MKNFLVSILILIFCLNTLSVYAEVKFLDINYNGEKRIYYPYNQPILKLAKNKKSIPIKISTKKMHLKSSLKDNFEAICCLVKNESDEVIELAMMTENPKDAIAYNRYQNPRFPSVYLLVPKTLMKSKDDFSAIFSEIGGFIFFYAIFDGLYNLCIKVPITIVQSLWYTAAAPYYYVHDKKDNILIQEDLSRFKEEKNLNQIVQPDEKIAFFILIKKDYKLSFTIKIDKDNEFNFQPQNKPPRAISEIRTGH